MLDYIFLYLVEIVVFILTWIIGLIYYKINKPGILKYMGWTSFAFIIIFFITFSLEKPKIYLNEVEEIEVKTVNQIKKPITFYHFQNITPEVKMIGKVNTYKTGEYDIQVSVNTWIGEYKKNAKIKVVDNKPPQISLQGEEEYQQSFGSEYIEPGYVATDNYDGKLTNKVQISREDISDKEYNIKYEVKDSSGNNAIQMRHVIIVDNVSPELNQNGIIYLTFDDGPSTNITPKILDILKEKGIKATFFILNYDEEKESIVKREYDEGHTVAIHGYSHTYSEIYQSVETYMNNITKLQDKIKNTTGYNATITRFPGGSSNTVSKKYCPGIMTELCKEVIERGYTYFDWNVDSNDAGNAKTSEDVYNNVTKGLRKERANVVLMHDFSGNNKTLDALTSIIDYGIENGYTFGRIMEDTPMVTHTPNN